MRPFILIALLLLVASRALSAGENPPPSRRIDIGDLRLYIHCLGQGQPAVILEHGLGGSSRDWSRVQQGLSHYTQACVYDRAGYGQSDLGPPPRRSSRLVSELRTLLARAGIAPPYILAGHSFGGYNVRLFASFYPQEVAGLVLVDSPHEDQVEGLFQNHLMREIDPQGLLQQLWKPELLSLLPIDTELFAGLLGLTPNTLRAILDESAAFKESGEELRAARVRPEVPLVVIHHGRPILNSPLGTPMEQQWEALQRQLASRYRHHTFILAKDSGHNIPREQPTLIIEAIRRLLEARSSAGPSLNNDKKP